MRHVRVILLCSLFLLPYCYPSARNSCVEQNSVGDNVLKEQDTLCIETEETESEIIYRLCFGRQEKRKVVFELQEQFADALQKSSIESLAAGCLAPLHAGLGSSGTVLIERGKKECCGSLSSTARICPNEKVLPAALCHSS